jgi:UDP-N-acetylglucosamine--N-acetylmuramyl-(pentapeptide) pyrophosphoryl-undecaprenol N-acetylglucosamine transferase
VRRLIVLTGGGTGGHVFAMQAVAESLRALGTPTNELRFVGSRRGLEAELLADSSIDLVLLSGRGIQRSMTLRTTWTNLRAVLGLAGATLRATWMLSRERAACVVSVGGYASLAMDAAAVMTRTPLVLIDLDAVPSATHALFRRFARRRCVAFDDGDPHAVVTGAPIRREIRDVTRRANESGVDDANSPSRRFTVVVMTGSLGARSVNLAVSDLAQRWRERGDLRIIHVSGQRDYSEMSQRNSLRDADALIYELVPFAQMAALYAVADLAVCRAGATTVAELTYLGVPSILVPLPGAPNDHQTCNAEGMVKWGGAVLLRDDQLSSQSLGDEIESLMSDPQRLVSMSQSATTQRHRDASAEIATVVREFVQ